MNHDEAEALLRKTLAHIDGVWIAHVPHGGAQQGVEIGIRGDHDRPGEAHLTEAAACVAALADIVPKMERALNGVPESDPLFPALGARSWSLEGLSFIGDDPARCTASFTLNESGHDFVYVEYLVELERGQVVSARAHVLSNLAGPLRGWRARDSPRSMSVIPAKERAPGPAVPIIHNMYCWAPAS